MLVNNKRMFIISDLDCILLRLKFVCSFECPILNFYNDTKIETRFQRLYKVNRVF